MTRALLDPLYEAATRPEMWNVFLRNASEVLRADKAGIFLYSPRSEQTTIVVDLGLTEEARRDTEQMVKFSPWIAEIRKHQDKGWYSGSPEDVLSMERYRKSKFYNDFCRKHEIEWIGVAIVFTPLGSLLGLAVSRPDNEGAFSEADKELLRKLVPHLGRTFRVYEDVAALRERNAAGQRALDLIGAACITLDSSGRILSMDRLAEALITEGGALRVKDGRLLAGVSVEQNALDACVVPACACGVGICPDPGAGAVVLHSCHGDPLYLSVLPYHSSSLLEGSPVALVFITTPEEQGCGEHRLWRSMFGMSPAECRVAEMMKRGMDVAEISKAMRIKSDTVRYYQKCVYRKTGARGQGPLMRLLTRIPSSRP